MRILPSAPNGYDVRDQNSLRQSLTAALADLSQAQAAIKVLQASSGGGGGGITSLTTDVVASGTGAVVATIQAGVVSNAKLATMAAYTLKANITGSTAAPTDQTLTALLDALLASTQGDIIYRNATVWTVLPAGTSGYVLSTGGAGANPSWVAASAGGISQLTSDVTAGPGSGSQAATIAASAVTNAKMANMATLTIKSNITGGGAAPADNSLSAILDAAFAATRALIIFRGASTWTTLAPGATGTVLRSNGASADPSYDTLTSLMDAAFSSTRGAMLFRGASAWGALAASTSGYVLQTNGAGTDPTWVAAGSSPTAVSSLRMFPAGVGVLVSGTTALKARTYSPDGTELTGQSIVWTTSDATKATVSGGVVTGVAAGTATITATCNGQTATCAVTVIVGTFEMYYLAWRDTQPSTGAFTVGGDAAYYWDVNGVLTSSSANTARNAHHWGGRRGLLVEPIYENGITKSTDITDSAWTKTSCSTSGTLLGADGSTNAHGIVGSSGQLTLVDGTLHVSINCNSTASVGHGGIWIVSRGSKPWFMFQYKDRSGGFQQGWMNMDTGAVVDLTGMIARTERVANGMWLIEWVKTATDTAGAGQAKIACGFTDFRNTAGVGGFSGGVGRQCTNDGAEVCGYVWFAQSSKIRYAGTPIITTTATIARSQNDSVTFPFSFTPTVRGVYYRGMEMGIYNSSLDGSQVFYSIDGSTSQGTHYRYVYMTTAQKVFLFTSEFASGNGNPNTQTPNPVWNFGDEIELYTDISVGSNYCRVAQVANTPGAAVQNSEVWGAYTTAGASYNAAYGGGTVLFFLGQKSGGTLQGPVMILELKSWHSTFPSNFAGFRRLGSQIEPVYSLLATPIGNEGGAAPTCEIGETIYVPVTVKGRTGELLQNRVISFGSSQTGVATVAAFGDGNTVAVTGVAAGRATISAYSEGVYTRFFVFVNAVT